MKAFLIHSFNDFYSENGLRQKLFKTWFKWFNPDVDLFYFEAGDSDWKEKAREKIKQADFIIYLKGDTYSENIVWELEISKQMNKKIFTIHLENELLKFSLLDVINTKLMTYSQVNLRNEGSGLEQFKKQIYFIGNSDMDKQIFMKEIVYNLSEKNQEFESLNEQSSGFYQQTLSAQFNFLINKIELLSVQKEDLNLPEVLEDENSYSECKKRIDTQTTIISLRKDVNKHIKDDYGLFNIELDKLEKEENINKLFEQYKLFLNSSELLMQRRQGVNSFYITANTILITLFGAVVALKLDLNYALLIAFGLTLVGVFLTVSWETILSSYGQLNKSKIAVISIIEKKLPVSLFDAEWEVLSESIKDQNYKSFTESEIRNAKLFRRLYFVVMLVIGGYFIIKKIGPFIWFLEKYKVLYIIVN